MLKVYYGSNLDAIYWNIYVDNSENVVSYLPSGLSSTEAADRLCQTSLFDDTDIRKVFVLNADSWKLADKQTKRDIAALQNCDKNIALIYESASLKNKIFTELKIDVKKATSITKKSKISVVTKLLEQSGIKLDSKKIDELVSQLPDNIEFIKNEILKLRLVGQESFTSEELQKIVFDVGDATVFNIIDSWLNGDQDQTIQRLNDLIAKNITIQAFIPIFALKLMQIKLFLTAKLNKWPSELITTNLGLPFWQQNIYNNLRPWDKSLIMVKKVLNELYDFDINVKKEKNIPYTQLIKILFK